ncbi:MAG: DNA repair protein RecN, partial [Ilumatobacteraceae bacterium]
MLSELHVEHLGVIERLDLVLGAGLTAVTGETGAGKTMLVEALELLVGGRADASIVRPGAPEVRIDGRFVAVEPAGTDGELVLSRVVPADGRSRAYVDGRPSTVAALAEVAAPIVDLHGQHAHQSLLAPATQRAALDRFGDIDLTPLRAARARLTELDAELATLGGDERARAREIDLLAFQVEELTAAALDDSDEEQRLALVEDELADAVGHREAGAVAHAALADDGGGRDALALALGAVTGRAPYGAIEERTRSLLAELDDVVGELHRVVDGIEEDPARLAEVRARRQQLRDLCRKYGDTLDDVRAYRDDAARRLSELARFEQRAAELDEERRAALQTERMAAAAVGRARREAAPRLAGAVTVRLRELAMAHAEVAVTVGEHDDDHPGDRVQFLLSANPGSPLLPLNRVASGGELARAMLALRLVLTGIEDDTGRTLVFDEVDAGIGGAAAGAVARALAEVAQRHQVLVVTHLAQVAALAATQVVVRKHVAAGATSTTAAVVDGDARVAELARMLSGAEGGAAARRHA